MNCAILGVPLRASDPSNLTVRGEEGSESGVAQGGLTYSHIPSSESIAFVTIHGVAAANAIS